MGAVTTEEKDKLIRWLIEEQEKHVEPIELKIDHVVYKETCRNLEESLAELEENVQGIGNCYWNVAKSDKKTDLGRRSDFEENLNDKLEFRSEKLVKLEQKAEGQKATVNYEKVGEETSKERDERVKREIHEEANRDPAAALRRFKERMQARKQAEQQTVKNGKNQNNNIK